MSTNKINYATQNQALRFVFGLADLFLEIILGPPASLPAKPIVPPKRILLVNGAHLGDVLQSTACVRALKQMFPHVEIGMLVGGWGINLVPDQNWVKHAHVIDYWKHNRSAASLFGKIKKYWLNRRQGLRQIQALSYDVAVHLNPYFPDFSPLLWQSQIPIRIGFSSAGCRALYSHAVDDFNENEHIAHHFLRLLQALQPLPLSHGILKPILPETHALSEKFQELQAFIRTQSQGHYRVIHMGTGDTQKLWPQSQWHRLLGMLLKQDCFIVFTGRGQLENSAIQALMQNQPRCLNICDLLTLPELIEILRQAEIVYSIDSLPAHLAAAVETPCVCLYQAKAQAAVWGPLGSQVRILFKDQANAELVFNTGEGLLNLKPPNILIR